MFKPKSKNIYSIFQNQRTYEELNKWLTEACPVINDEKNNKSEQKEKINITEILENQNLTTENEYIKNEFIDINKRIENIKYKLNLNHKGGINKNKNNQKINFEFELTPIKLLLIFIGTLLLFTIYSTIRNLFSINKEHIK